MLRKRIISAISAVTVAFAMIGSLSVYAENAPKVTAKVTGYTGEVGSTYNLVVSYTGFDDLYCDLENWIEWGIDGYQIEIDMPGTYKTDFTGTGRNGAFASTPSEGFSAQVSYNTDVNKLRIAQTFQWNSTEGGGLLYEKNATVTIPVKVLVPYTETVEFKVTAAGFSTAEYDADGNGTFPKYDLKDGKVTVEGDTITISPAIPDSPITTKNETVGQFNGKYLKYIAHILETVDAQKKVRIKKMNGNEVVETRDSGRTLAQIVNGVASGNNTITGTIAVGVLTSNEADVFTFELYE